MLPDGPGGILFFITLPVSIIIGLLVASWVEPVTGELIAVIISAWLPPVLIAAHVYYFICAERKQRTQERDRKNWSAAQTHERNIDQAIKKEIEADQQRAPIEP